MRKLSGTLKLDLAQYRELEAFAKCGSDLDAATQQQLRRGERTVELMKLAEYEPLPVQNQIARLKVNSEGLFDELPVTMMRDFEKAFLEAIDAKHHWEMEEVDASGGMDDKCGREVI